MKQCNLLDSIASMCSPSFNEAKHNVFSSELKQLHVAITRTRQRLWIWEHMAELSKPMFDYWKKRSLLQVRQLDDKPAQAMQIRSSPEEWKSQGIKVCVIFKTFISLSLSLSFFFFNLLIYFHILFLATSRTY